MTTLGLIQLSVMILKGVLATIPGGGNYQVLADGVQAAINELTKVHDTEVTKAQLQSLRVKALR